jgi:hypothetical protein
MDDERKKEETEVIRRFRSKYDMPMLRDRDDAPHYKMLMPEKRKMQQRIKRDKRA